MPLVHCNRGPDLDLKGKGEMAMEISPVKENDGGYDVSKEKPITECVDKSGCTKALPNEHIKAIEASKDVEINITECTKSGEEALVENGYLDATESSSSFGNTDSGTESKAASSDPEVESFYHGNSTSALGFDGVGDLFRMRKKKLTTQWREHIRPLMWRCKWVELQLRELQCQETKYYKELTMSDQRKQLELEKLMSEDLHVKSVPAFYQNQRANTVKRKKRKRVEETADVAGYMADHNVFSYYVNKRPFACRAYGDVDCGNPAVREPDNAAIFGNDEFGVDGEWKPLEFKDGNAFGEIFRKIEEAKSQVHRLRAQIDKVISENAGKSASSDSDSLHAPHDGLGISNPNRELPNGHGDFPAKTLYTLPHSSENKAGDQVIPGIAVSNCGKEPVPDTIESTDQQQVDDHDTVYNPSTKQELPNPLKVRIRFKPADKPQAPSDMEADACDMEAEACDTSDSKPESSSKCAAARIEQPMRLRSAYKIVTAKNKRKRGRRKAGSGKWSKKPSV